MPEKRIFNSVEEYRNAFFPKSFLEELTESVGGRMKRSSSKGVGDDKKTGIIYVENKDRFDSKGMEIKRQIQDFYLKKGYAIDCDEKGTMFAKKGEEDYWIRLSPYGPLHTIWIMKSPLMDFLEKTNQSSLSL